MLELFSCPVCPSLRLHLPIITRKTSFSFKAGILCHQSRLIQPYRSLIKLHILSLGSILTTKYRLKYLCVSIWQREQRRYLYWNCIALDRFLPPPAGIDRAWGDQELLQLQPALAAALLVCESASFSYGTGGMHILILWFLFGKCAFWEAMGTAGGRSELTCKGK